MNILAMISRDTHKASTAYRLAQYVPLFESRGDRFEFLLRRDAEQITPEQLCRFDLLINQKCLLNRMVSKKLMGNSRRVIFDFDDAIYTRPGGGHSLLTALRVKNRMAYWLQEADLVTVSSRFLANYARRYTDAVEIIPMALDLRRWCPRESREGEKIRLGWAGAPVNLPLIERLDGILAALIAEYSHVELAIYSGQRPIMSCPFVFQSFEPGQEESFVQSLDIGLLPLMTDEFALGKSPIKAVQYLACAVPVVGTVAGATAEILSDGNSLAVATDNDWISALQRLIGDAQLRRKMGAAGRRFVEEYHDRDQVVRRLEAIFAGRPGMRPV